MIMTPRVEKALTEWRAAKCRLLLAKFKSKQCNMSIIVCYVQSNDSHEEREDRYYEELQSVIDEIPERDMKIVIGDFNAKVGSDNQEIENVLGFKGLGGAVNENEAHFITWIMRFCIHEDISFDRGTTFTSQLHQTTAYNPPANRMEERFHRTLKVA
ncbi:craniofacial development protein 2-like [Palaemon carinicauda]|uniref:craniofacial development protein 2-like n=1 Tax=Palaemon carinicauda TaxID=392227 RepID=UPI0035B5746C